MPEAAPDLVKQKALAAYAKTYWYRIYPAQQASKL
jgi:hypothetical protein